MVKSLPPSSAGKGTRFINPRFILIRTVMLRSERKPSAAASPIAEDMPTGPDTASRVYLPVSRSMTDSQHIRITSTDLRTESEITLKIFFSFSPVILKSMIPKVCPCCSTVGKETSSMTISFPSRMMVRSTGS